MRLIGYTCQPFCGKSCCRQTGKGKLKRRAETHVAKRRERRAWQRDQGEYIGAKGKL